MFYVCDIYDKANNVFAQELFASSVFCSGYDFNKATKYIYCRHQDLVNIMVCVFDSKDGVKEWYYINDILSLVRKTDIEIKGVGAYSQISLKVKIAIAEASKSFVETIAKFKLLGADVDELGVLKSIPKSFVKGDTIVIPDRVYHLSSKIRANSDIYRGVSKVIVPSSLCMDIGSNTIVGLNLLMRNNISITDKTFLVIDNDFTITPKFFIDLPVNYYIRGTLCVKGFENLMERLITCTGKGKGLTYKYVAKGFLYSEMAYTVADRNYIYTLDFKHFKVIREVNNKRLCL